MSGATSATAARSSAAGVAPTVQRTLEGEQEPARQQQHPPERADELRQALPHLRVLGRANGVPDRVRQLLTGGAEGVVLHHGRGLLVGEHEVVRVGSPSARTNFAITTRPVGSVGSSVAARRGALMAPLHGKGHSTISLDHNSSA
jgi:hypothetical protein